MLLGQLAIKEESRVISDGREGVKILLVSSSYLGFGKKCAINLL